MQKISFFFLGRFDFRDEFIHKRVFNEGCVFLGDTFK